MSDSTPESQPDPQTEQQPNTSPDVQASSSESSAAAKPRSPVERAIVWGIIAVLVVVAGLEARARFGFNDAYDSLLNRLQKGEETGALLSGPEVTDTLKGRKPDETRKVRGLANGASRVDIYRFGGVLQKRTLYVYYGTAGKKGKPEVVAVTDQEAEKFTSPPPRPSTGDDADPVDPETGRPLPRRPRDGAGMGSGSRRPAGAKTKGSSSKKSTTNTPPAPAKSKPAPGKTKSTPGKTKSVPAKTKSTAPKKKKKKSTNK